MYTVTANETFTNISLISQIQELKMSFTADKMHVHLPVLRRKTRSTLRYITSNGQQKLVLITTQSCLAAFSVRRSSLGDTQRNVQVSIL